MHNKFDCKHFRKSNMAYIIFTGENYDSIVVIWWYYEHKYVGIVTFCTIPPQFL